MVERRRGEEQRGEVREHGVVEGGLSSVQNSVVLHKAPSELHPKVRNHGEGPY